MNIGLIFINEKNHLERQNEQKTDKLISKKFKNNNILPNLQYG